jgi:hypothetical protein
MQTNLLKKKKFFIKKKNYINCHLFFFFFFFFFWKKEKVKWFFKGKMSNKVKKKNFFQNGLMLKKRNFWDWENIKINNKNKIMKNQKNFVLIWIIFLIFQEAYLHLNNGGLSPLGNDQHFNIMEDSNNLLLYGNPLEGARQ